MSHLGVKSKMSKLQVSLKHSLHTRSMSGMGRYQIAGNFLGQLISIVHGGWDIFCWLEGGSIYIVLKPHEMNRIIWLRDIFTIGKR